MIQFFLECAIRGALIVAATAVVLYAMRVKVASVKHRVWTAVLLLMLVLPLWIAWGPKAPIRILPANVQNFAADLLIQAPAPAAIASQKIEIGKQAATPPQPFFSATELLLLSIYLFGAIIFLARLAIGTWKAGRLIRESSPSPELSSRLPSEVCRSEGSAVGFASLGGRSFSSDIQPSHTSVVLTPEGQNFAIRSSGSCAAPVTVGCFRPTILLPENWRDWSASQLAAVLAHEREHARRRDPLIQWLALFNRAIFWFHPAAWWLERELSALAEECCDAAVLAQGHDPGAYAGTLMHMARAVMHSGARIKATGTAMPGPRLPQRICKVIAGQSSAPMSGMRAACVVATCVAVCAAFVMGTLAVAQSSGSGATQSPTFEVASIKPNDSDKGTSHYSHFSATPAQGTLIATNELLRDFIMDAYAPPGGRLENNQLIGGPAWINAKRYDIDAKVDDAVRDKWMKLPDDQQEELMERAERTLLADRFKLKVTVEKKDERVYALVVAKGGPKLNKAKPLAPGREPPANPKTPGEPSIGSWSTTMDRLAGGLSRLPVFSDGVVVNKTGLTGQYEVFLHWGRGDDTSLPSIFTALEEQLGLRIDSTKAPVDTIVIDHVEEPTPN